MSLEISAVLLFEDGDVLHFDRAELFAVKEDIFTGGGERDSVDKFYFFT